MSQTTLVERALDQICNIWQVEEKDVVARGPKGFDWLPGSHLVSVRAVMANKNDRTYQMLSGMGGVEARAGGIRLSIETKVVSDFPCTNMKVCDTLNLMAPLMSSTYSLVYPPAIFLRSRDIGEESYDLSLFSSVYIDENLAGWLPRFFAQMAIMQPIDAEIRGHKLPELLGGGRPGFALEHKKQNLDGILEVADQVYAPAGASSSKWAGSDEFANFARNFGNNDGCFANGDRSGLSAEVSFGHDTALIRCWTDQPHPQLGNGLLVTMQLPFWLGEERLEEGAAMLNFMESRAWTEVAQFGCWHTRSSSVEASSTIAHTYFVPNALFQPGLVQNFVIWEISRARWVKQTLFSGLRDLTMSQILATRAKLRPV